MTSIKKILLIGRSGRGKSTLANVLLNKNNSFEEVFKEGELSISQTRSIQSAEFKHQFTEQEEEKEISYHIIDTVGIGDTNLLPQEVLDIINEAIYLARDGINRVIFVTDGRFDKAEMATYNLLKEAIFDQDIIKHTTIVRTRFDGFRNKEECKKDIELMITGGGDLAEIISSSRDRVIHVNNPSIKFEDEALDKKGRVRARTKSREKLLKHLSESCQETYNPPNLVELIKKIHERMEKKKKLSEAIDELKEQLQKSKGLLSGSGERELEKDIKELEKKLEREKDAIRQSLFEHIHYKINNEELKNYLSKNPTNSNVPKKVQQKLDLKLF
jgi:ABC-type oligopeptide transport system ATPase subunit